MLSRVELATRMAAIQREENRVGGIWLACFFALLFAHVGLFIWVNSLASQWLAGLLVVELIAFVGGNVWLVIRYFRKRPARFGLLCTNCGAPLSPFACRVLFVTGQCPICKAFILSDNDNTAQPAAADGPSDERFQRS